MFSTSTPKYKNLAIHIIFILIFFIAVIETNLFTNLLNTFIAHDDWTYLLQMQARLSDKMITEGRWLQYLWSFVIVHTSPEICFLICFISYIIVLLTITRTIQDPLTANTLFLALFFNPVISELFKWPVTLSVELLFCIPTLFILHKKYYKLFFLFSILVMLIYPLIFSFVLLYAVFNNKYSIIAFCKLIVIYISGYFIGILLLSIINYFVFSRFGVEIALWRNPHPIHHLYDIYTNISLLFSQLITLIQHYLYPIIATVIFCIVTSFFKTDRTNFIKLLIFGLIFLALDSMITISSGVVIPVNRTIWFWLFLSSFIVINNHTQHWIKYLSIVLLSLLAIWGMQFFYFNFKHAQNELSYEKFIIYNYYFLTNNSNNTNLILCGDPHVSSPLNFVQFDGVALSMSYRYHIHVQYCNNDLMKQIQSYRSKNNFPIMFKYNHDVIMYLNNTAWYTDWKL